MSTDYEIKVKQLPPEDGGGFLAWVPDLPGCMSDGDTYRGGRKRQDRDRRMDCRGRKAEPRCAGAHPQAGGALITPPTTGTAAAPNTSARKTTVSKIRHRPGALDLSLALPTLIQHKSSVHRGFIRARA